MTVEQERIFLDYLRKTPRYQHWYPVFYVMANTGLRVGEITGLRWCDVDMESGMISVNHTLVYYNHRDEKGCYFSINTPKTKAGQREVPMTEGVKAAQMVSGAIPILAVYPFLQKYFITGITLGSVKE